ILSITTDNTSLNNTMMVELEGLVAHFGGKSARTHCFLHIVNLITKSLIKQFN
ncbi:hypothetical protein BDN67DRAFT_867168, partial [Paxillus ammoniavirescens]